MTEERTLLQPHHYATGFSCLGIFLCLISLLFFQKDYIIERIVKGISFEEEREIGAKLFQFNEAILVKDAKVKAQFKLLTDRLTAAVDKKGYKYQIYLSKYKEVNAFALPGGYIIVNVGLVNHAKTPEEVLGVIAHEMAHVQKRHVLKGLINTLGLTALVGLLPETGSLISILGDNGSMLLQRHYSRALEYEADITAMDFLKQARVSPYGLKDFFAHLEGKNIAALALLNTHPATKERINSLDNLLKNDRRENYQPVPFDFQAFQAMVNNI